MQTKQWIEEEVSRLGSIQPWWHDIELPHGVRTINRESQELQKNHNEVKFGKLEQFFQFKDQSVIDLGCNEGVYCQAARDRGATRIVGVDINSHRVEKARFVSSVLGTEGVEFQQASAYDLETDQLGGKFDLAFALGLLHRVPDPYGLIVKACELADAVVFEWSAEVSDEPIMRFWGGGFKEYDRDNTGYWRMSRRCVREILFRTDFTVYADIEPDGSRAIMAAAKNKECRVLSCAWLPLAEDPTPKTPQPQPLFGKLRSKLRLS